MASSPPSKRTRRPKPKARAARSSRARRAPAKRTDRSRGARPNPARRSGCRHLSPRAAEALGVGLIVLAALWIMGLWLGTGGPVGARQKRRCARSSARRDTPCRGRRVLGGRAPRRHGP